ncbi:Nephrocystin-3 [Durusdinium trenchii]|uniref:Nephrocystin-3 n=1 Tax=Durusdinium trenchii TaxID=1381693 RepID=A0ABP0NDY8_9DINO
MGCGGSHVELKRQQVVPAREDVHAQPRETAVVMQNAPVEAAERLQDAPRCKTTTDLREYFENLYREGGEFVHCDYEEIPDAVLHTWLHKPTGIQIWRDVIDLTNGGMSQVLFHYTDELAFRNITHPRKEASEIWASLNTEGPNANAWWGRGVYTVPLPPDRWQDREELLDNNFRNMMRRDELDQERGAEYVKREYPKRAAFCVPILVNPSNAFDVSKRATPEMEAAGKEPGRNLVGKLLNEPGMPPRCCIVVQVFGEDGAASVQHARGRLLDALRSRASAAQGDVRALRRVKWRLSSVLQHRGFYEEALPMLQELLRTGEESEGPESPQALAIANNLALVWEQMGHFAEAEKLHRSTLEVRGRTLGRENPNTLKSVNNLANVLQKMGQFTEAEQLHRRAMEARERALGAEHAETLNSISNLASVLKEMSQYLEAEELTRRVLEARERIFGPEHPNTLLSVNNLANSLKKVGRYEEAEELSRRAVDACERTLGPEHPRTLASLDTLAAILSDLCRYDEAEILSRRAVDSFEKALGPEHPYTLVSLETLAQILANMGQGSDAETLYRRVLTAYERTLGAEHPKTIRSHQSLMALENALPAAQVVLVESEAEEARNTPCEAS